MDDDEQTVLPLTVQVVRAYVGNNPIQQSGLPGLIAEVAAAIGRLKSGEAGGPGPAEAARQKPAVPIKRSITPDFLISLEDGKKLRSLKRHLMAQYGMTPQQYRTKWNLPPDYPMVAPNYAAERSKIGKQARMRQLRATSQPKRTRKR